MQKISAFFILLIILIVTFFPKTSYGQTTKYDCSISQISEQQSSGDDDHTIESISLKIKGQQIPLNSNLEMTIRPLGGDVRTIGEDTGDIAYYISVPAKVTLERNKDGDTIASINTPFDREGNTKGAHAEDFTVNKYEFNLRTTGHQGRDGQDKQYLLCKEDAAVITVPKISIDNKFCTISYLNKDFKPGTEIKVKAVFRNEFTEKPEDAMLLRINQVPGGEVKRFTPKRSDLESSTGFSLGNDLLGGNSYEVKIDGKYNVSCSNTFTVDEKGGYAGCITDSDCGGKYCIPDAAGKLGCYEYPGNEVTNPCQPKSNKAIPDSCKTAIGSIGINPEGFARSVLVLFLSLSGGILVLLFIANGFKLMTSQGDPKKIAEARESLIAAVAGLLLIIFSLSILRLITVDILGIPGFS